MTAHIARLTPPGAGGVAVVLLWGSQAGSVLHRLLGRPFPRAADRLLYAHLKDARGMPLDEVVVARSGGPLAAVERDAFEISGHGGGLSTERLLRRLERLGAERQPPPPMAPRGLEQAAWDALGASITWLATGLLLAQAQGLLRREVERVLVELEADPPAARARLERLLHSYQWGRALVSPRRVQLVGPPNAGKSSLFNVLLADTRALVTRHAGTTRDVLEETAVLNGVPVRLVDGAGLREAECDLEREGIRRALEALKTADVGVLVVNGSRAPDPAEKAFIIGLIAGRPELAWLCACNQSDLGPPHPEWQELAPAKNQLEVSAHTGQGVDALRSRLREVVAPGAPRQPDPPRPMIWTTHQRDRLVQTLGQSPLGAAATLRSWLR